jgi:hypothetical protein
MRSEANACEGLGVESRWQTNLYATQREKMRGIGVINMLILYIVIFVILSVLYYLSRRSGDPYGTSHLSFNRVPGSPDPPQTEWLNMGFWKVRYTVTFQTIFIDT